jgi:hypothetical protein
MHAKLVVINALQKAIFPLKKKQGKNIALQNGRVFKKSPLILKCTHKIFALYL